MMQANFLTRSLSPNQRQAIERRKYIEQSDLQTKQALNQSVNQAIEKVTNLEEIEDYYKFRTSHSEGFTSTPCLCQVLDQNELNNYKDHTRGY
ncbi:hypothetical protein DKL61_07080 [Gammaproteobacteria bacterium ESL0073]|nr:hypothetical protein DKL61_07080 [Gammaproteobacteria bacterium ESL0073]